MKKNLIAVLVVATVAIAVASSAASASDDAIKQVFVQLDRCLANGDAKCAGALFAEDATFASPAGGTKITKGKTQIVKFIEESLAGTKGVKQTRSVVNVRMIGEDLALVDAAVAAGGPAQEGAADAAPEQYHDVAVMVLKDGKWLCQDIRSYVAGLTHPGKKDCAPEAKKEPAPEAKKEPAPPAEKEPAAPAKE